MAGKYRIGKVEEDEEYAFLRVVELKTERSQTKGLVRSVNKNITGKFIKDIYLPTVKETIFEVFLKIDIETLRRIDDDIEERERYIRRYILDNIPDNPNIVTLLIPMLVITPENMQKSNKKYLTDQDIEYLNDLLMWIYNDIYSMPLLHFEPIKIYNEKGEIINTEDIPTDRRMGFYNDFVRRLLEIKNQTNEKVKPAITIPSFYKRRNISELFDLYKDEPQEPDFVIVDFGHSRLFSPKMLGVIPRIHKHYRELGIERYFVYGFNVKPHKRGAESPFAEDMGVYLSGFNAIGSPHRLSRAPFFIITKSLEHLPKIFNKEEYRYYPLTSLSSREAFGKWNLQYYGRKIDYTDPNRIPRDNIYKYNIHSLGLEIHKLSEVVSKGETELLREILETKKLSQEVNNQIIAKINKKYGGKTHTIQESLF